MRTDELRAELEQLAGEIAPFEGNALAAHRRVRRRRAVLTGIAAVLVVVVVTALTIGVFDGGKTHVEVSTPRKLVQTTDFGRVDFVVVPGSSAVQQALEDSPIVVKYAPLEAGDRGASEDVSWPTMNIKPMLCALQTNTGYEVQVASGSSGAHEQLASLLGSDVDVYDIGRGHYEDVQVFMNVDAPPDQVAAARSAIGDDPAVKSFVYLDHDAAYERFKADFADQPALVESTSPDVLPESFDVVLRDAATASAFTQRAERLEGADTVINRHAQSFNFDAPVLPAGAVPTSAEVFMDVDAPRGEIEAVQTRLESDPRVAAIDHLDHDDAYESFKRDFADQPVLLATTTPEMLPESFRIELQPGTDRFAVQGDYDSVTGVDAVIVPPKPLACPAP